MNYLLEQMIFCNYTPKPLENQGLPWKTKENQG